MTAQERTDLENKLTTFLCIGPGFWGKGKTLKDAIRNCRKEGCKARDRMIAYWGSDDLSMTGSGFVSATDLIKLGEVQ